MTNLTLDKIKNMLRAHNDSVYRMEARENLGEIIDFLLRIAKCQWQPIETAPMDTICKVFDAYSNCEHTAIQQKSCDKDGVDTGFAWFTGYTWGNAQAIYKPTHWKPIDEPPVPESSSL